MIFKHEFEIDETRVKDEGRERLFAFKKHHFAGELGAKIGEEFGWKQREGFEPPRWVIEIAAFPIESWRQFLNDLNKHVPLSEREEVKELLRTLHLPPVKDNPLK